MLEEAAKARPPQAGPRDGPVPHAGRSPGSGVLAPNGWTIYTELAGLHAPQAARGRLCRGEHAAGREPQAVGSVGHWDKYQEHMFIVEVDEDHAREKTINALKPMNCPCHVQMFNSGPEVLPRPAAAHGGVRLVQSVRALGRTARHHACARVHPGRCAIFSAREDQIESECAKFIDFLSSSTRTSGSRSSKSCSPPAPKSVWGPRKAGTRWRPRWKMRSRSHRPRLYAGTRRGRVLCAQAGLQTDRRDRPGLAMRHVPGRPEPAGTAGRDLHRRGWGEAPALICCTAPALAVSSGSSAF